MSCKTMNIDLANVPPVPIQIGVAGENAFRTITFDASTWGADFPDATYTVVYKRSDGYIYPVLVNAAADAIVWSPTDTDTAVSGNGQIEVRLFDGETIGKTIVMQTFVAPSLSGDESEPSTPAPDWVNDVAADADRAEAAVSHYPKIVNGVWFVWDVGTGEFVSTGISAQGEDGVSPTATVEAIDGGHRVTITDADGAHTFDVMDGEGGSGGGAVESVNGKTGVVVLGASDVGALPDTYVAPVQSVNGMTGPVTLDAADVGALPSNTPIPAAVTEQTVAGWGFTKNTGTYSKPASGIPASDLAQAVQTSLSKADTALQTDTLQTALDDNVPPARFVLVRNGNTITTVDKFISIANLFVYTSRRVMFLIVLSQSNGTVTSAQELYPTIIDSNNRALTLVGEYDGDRYTAELTAASLYSTMTGTLVVEPIVTQSDIPDASTSAPAMDGTASAGSSAAYARGDHVHPTDTSRLATNQGVANAGKFMVVGNDGNITAVTMAAWQGGSF